MFPVSVYVAVAFAIALAAFGIAQIAPGLGVAFVALTSTGWAAYAVHRRRRMTPQ